VTLDEVQSTRGYANALRLAMTGQLGPDGMQGKRLYEVMDSCLSCKACKSECPSNVDMAKLKAEFMHMYNDAHGACRSADFIVSYMDRISGKSGFMPFLNNAILRSWPGRKMLELCRGIDSRRRLPKLQNGKASSWFSEATARAGNLGNVVLFDDTYMNRFDTQVGISAVELLQSCGYNVVRALAGCCQKHRISRGFLREAKERGEATLRNLDTYISQGLKIVVCEPGCCSALVDDLPDLIEDEALGRRIRENVMMIDTFLAREHAEGRLSAEFSSPHSKLLIQGHCHQKALFGVTSMKYLLDLVPGVHAEELDAGCCGMGDLYGYEKKHYALSMKVGEDRLFPLIRDRQEDAVVVSCGFDCRTQIYDATGVQALHWVETIRGPGVQGYR
jgi:Fe-S oxidoreductase